MQSRGQLPVPGSFQMSLLCPAAPTMGLQAPWPICLGMGMRGVTRILSALGARTSQPTGPWDADPIYY